MRRTSDVRAQPIDKDPGYPAAKQQGHGPDTAAIIECLLQDRELIESCDMIYLIVDNRAPKDVSHWPAFAQWWAARRNLLGLRMNEPTYCGYRQPMPMACEQFLTTGQEFLSWKQL